MVFKAQDPVLNRIVAIKQIVVPTDEAGDEIRQRAIAEAQAHKHVAASSPALLVEFIDLINDPRGLFLITEFIEGPSLEWILQNEPAAMDQRQALGIVAATAKGLAAIHAAGMIHRDLKPSNILMPRAGGLKIADFGLAAAMAEQHAMDLGSVRYMAPELLQGEAGSVKSDLYSLGIIAYEMLAGRDKFNDAFRTILRDQRNQSMRWVKWHTNVRAKATPLNQLNPDIPQSLADLVARLMEKEPSRRVGSPDELVEAIRTHFASGQQDLPTPQAHQTVQPVVTGDVSETAHLPKRSKLPMILAGTLVLWVAVMAGFFMMRSQEKAQAYEDQIAAFAQQILKADAMHRKDNDYAAARDLFAAALVDIRKSSTDPDLPEKYKSQVNDMGWLATAGQARSVGTLAEQADDFVAARTAYAEYRDTLNKIRNSALLDRTMLSAAQAEDKISSTSTRAAFQQEADSIEHLLDEGNLANAIEHIRRLKNDEPDAQPDKDRLVALEVRYRQMRDLELNQATLAQATELVTQGHSDEAIDLLEEAIQDAGDAAWPPHREFRDALVLKDRIAENDQDLREAANDGDIAEELNLLQERMSFDPKPEFQRRINALRTGVLLEQASDAQADGKIDLADSLIDQILEIDAEHPQALAMKQDNGAQRMAMGKRQEAQTAYAQGQYEQAMDLAKEALEIAGDPDGSLNELLTQATGHLALENATESFDQGSESFDQDDIDRAARQLEQARNHLGNTQAVLALDQRIENMSAYLALVREGDSEFDRKLYGPAKRKYLQAREYSNNATIEDKIVECDFQNWLEQARRAVRQRLWDEADGFLQQAEAIKPNDPETAPVREQIQNRGQE